jgi:hypothetical protein
MKAPILVPPTEGEPLLLYIAAMMQVVSASLVVEREEEGHVTSRYLENRDTRFWYYICMPIFMLAMEYVGSTKARGISVISTKCRFLSVT